MNSEILKLLNTDPQAGMILLMEKYTGLIWKIVSFHLSNPEDIKECVNDTFAEFYFCKNRFDPEKADIPTFLSAIARNLSIARYRKESIRQSVPLLAAPIVEDTLLVSSESRADLEKAIASLKANEQQIILLKYYNGMTIQEIAASLSLPYETVKKRHQRGLGKLKHMLLCVLITLLLALITACAYKVLRYFEVIPPLFRKFSVDISLEIPSKLPEKQQEIANNVKGQVKQLSEVSDAELDTVLETEATNPAAADETSVPADNYSYVPGYGINETASVPSYKLYQSTTAENEYFAISLNDASYMNNTLRLEITAYAKDTSLITGENSQAIVRYDGQTKTMYESTTNIDENTTLYEMQYYDPELISYINNGTDFSVELYTLTLPFTLVESEAETLDDKFYQLEEDGGIMAVPRLENGSLIITIYPLNRGDYTILPALVRSISGESEGGEIYVTSSNEQKLIGTCVRYRPYNFVPYFEWNFGQADAGQYTLHIPYLYQSAKLPDAFKIPINLQDLTWEDTSYPVLGGEITIEDCSQLDLVVGEAIGDSCHFYEEEDTNTYWKLRLKCDSYESERTIIDLDLISRCELLPEEQIGVLGSGEVNIVYWRTQKDTETGIMEAVISANQKANDFAKFYLEPSSTQFGEYKDTILYRWNQSFNLTFTVDETK